MAGAIGQVEAAAAALTQAPLLSLSDAEISAETRRVFGAIQVLSARFLGLVHEADLRGIPDDEGAAGLTAWLTFGLAMSGPEAARLGKLARMLPSVPEVAQALAAGEVNVEQARVIAQTVTELPREVGDVGKAQAAATLTKLATDERLRPEILAQHKRTILELVAPEIAEEKLRKDVERAERSAHERRTFTLSHDGEGEYRVRGILDAEMAAILNAALDPLSGPRTIRLPDGPGSQTGGNAATDGTLFDGAAAAAGDGAHQGATAAPASAATGDGTLGGLGTADEAVKAEVDLRSAGARRADALIELCRRHLDTGDLPENGGEKPHLVLTMSWQELRDQVGAGLLDTGDLLTPATARRLACDALIIPAILGGDGQVLDLGRARRLIDGSLRRALVLRDKGCAFPGCDRPARWCHGHHIHSWADGGHTSIDNSVLLCGHHHREIHLGRWLVRIAADGHPEFVPPTYVDPERKPVRNTLHRHPHHRR